MNSVKGYLLIGVAALALTACSNDKGPGAIGSRDDIVVRNAGADRAPPPPAPDAVTEVEMSDTAAADKPSLAETIGDAAEGAAENVKEVAEEVADSVSDAVAPETQKAEEATAANTEMKDAPAMEEKVATNDAPQSIEPPKESKQVMEDDSMSKKPTTMSRVSMISPEEDKAAEDKPAEVAPAEETAAAMAPAEDKPAMKDEPKAEVMADEKAAPTAEVSMDVLESGDLAKIKAMQQVMKDDGLYSGPIDGLSNAQTLNALIRYQAANDLLPKMPAALPAVDDAVTKTDAAPAEAKADMKEAAPTAVKTEEAPAAPKAVNYAEKIKILQDALREKGFYSNSTSSGVLDTETLNAVSRYQAANGLRPAGITDETLEHLGLMKK